MEYLNLITYKSIAEKFEKAKRKQKVDMKKGVHDILTEHRKNAKGDIVEETVYFHYWSTEYSCYVTEKHRLHY